MSFRVERHFNLLILEEGEEYVADVSATMALIRKGKEAMSNGRLRIGSKSLVFQPDEVSASILKFPYRYIRNIGDSERDEASTIPVECEKFVQVATKTGATETRIVTPFSIHQAKITVNFLVRYASAKEYLQIIKNLQEASSKKVTEAEETVRDILQQVTASVQFDMSRLGHRERAILPRGHLWVRRVKPLLEVRGMLQISDEAIYFQPHPNFQSKPVKRLPHGDVLHVFSRTYGVQANALEIITVHGSCLYLCFEAQTDRDVVSATLQERRRGGATGFSAPSSGLSTMSETSLGDAEDVLKNIHRMTALWQSGFLSNFHYIDFLNCAAGRSQNDFSQYPVFPWVLKDYTSTELNLSSPEAYRDLTKPIGALNAKRLDYFKERMESMMEEEKFLYGTHYSTPAYVIYWLLRAMPERMLRLHNGHFDTGPRLFKSVPESWESVNESTASLMELIPEFFVLPATWLENGLGITTSDGPLGDVQLPAWASNVTDFICKMRAALESEQVSRMLPAWIDLIFGYKQIGEEAVKANNLFHPVCYTGSPGAAASTLPSHVLETQLQEFGRVPRQLFSEVHPPRLRIPHWEPKRLLEEPAMSEPWYKAVRHVSAHAADGFPATPSSVSAVGDATSPTSATGSHAAVSSGAFAGPVAGASERRTATNGGYTGDLQGGGRAVGAAAVGGEAFASLPSAVLQTLTPQAVASLSASGNITGVASCAVNMYAIGEDGCLRVSPLAGWSSPPADGAEDLGAVGEQRGGSSSSSSMRRNFRISPMPLSALAVLRTDLLAIGGHDNAIALYSSSCGSALAKCQVHGDTVTCLAVSPCGDVIVSGSRDQSVRTWVPTTCSLKSELTFDDLQQPIACCAGSRNLILAGATDGQLMAWDRRSGQPVMDRELGGDGVVQCAVDEDGTMAAALDGAGELRFWDLRHRCESVRLSVLARGASLCAARCFLTDFSGWALVGGAGAGGLPAVSLWGLPEQRELRAWPLDADRRGSHAEVQFLVRAPTKADEGPSASWTIPFLCASAGGSVNVFRRHRLCD